MVHVCKRAVQLIKKDANILSVGEFSVIPYMHDLSQHLIKLADRYGVQALFFFSADQGQ